jgi:peptide/nickel transport system ATP-binding protein
MYPILEVKNLTVEFKTEAGIYKAVDDVSFTLEKGKTLGIVGESGSGKSVTSLSIMRLIQSPPGKISGGDIVFSPEANEQTILTKLTNKEMCSFRGNRIAMIFQEPMTSLNPVYKCGKQVSESLVLHKKLSKKQARAKTIELFKEVLLPDPEKAFNSYPHQLSGGQKQRVMIAMAMCCNPDILIADEPTTALDVTVQKTILELMKSLQQKHGMSIIFITHDLGVVAEIADDVIVMNKGKIVEKGKVKDIFINPHEPYTKGLLACRPSLTKRLKVLPTVADFTEERFTTVLNDQNIFTTEERKENQTGIYSKEPLLKVSGLKTYYPVKRTVFGKATSFYKAVDDVSFDVFPGETLGLVGESGCGKTTLGRSLLKLIEPTAGKIEFNGENVIKLKGAALRNLRQNMQIIFQDPYSSLNPRFTVGNAIMEPLKVHNHHKNDKERKEKVIALLERVNMKADHFYRYPHEFSGGQRQRVCIARALALNPKFIICDESVSALDVSVQAQVLNLLNELKRDFGFTYIFISHDLSVVKFMSDRMMVMKEGKIVELGDADEICNNPKTDYTVKLISAIPKGIYN